MPANKGPENPLEVLKRIDRRLRIMEQARRLPSLIGAQVTKNSNQIITTGMAAVTQVTFAPPLDFDTDAFFDDVNNRYVIPDDLDGYYTIIAKTEWVSGTGAARTRLRYNGVGFTETYTGAVGGGFETTQLIMIDKYLNASDTVDLVVSHDQGTNRSIVGTGDDYGTYFGLKFRGR